jgi:hypothetical protein
MCAGSQGQESTVKMPEEQMARLGTDLNSIEVTYVTPVINDRGKALKKTVARKSVLMLSHILIIDENYDSKGNLLSETCRIFYETLGWLVLEEAYEEMMKYKMGHSNTVVGFRPSPIKQKRK